MLLTKAALSAWGLEKKQIQLFPNRTAGKVALAQTREGLRVLKWRTVIPPDTNRFFSSVALHCAAADIGLAPPLQPTQDGRLFFKTEELFWTLYPLIGSPETCWNPRQPTNSLRSAGQTLGKLHKQLEKLTTLPTDSFLRLPDIRASATNAVKLDSRLSTYAKRAVRFKPNLSILHWQWIHGDFSSRNLIPQQENSTGNIQVIDFDNASFFPRIYEVLRSFFSLRGNSEEGLIHDFDQFLSGYSKEILLTKIERKFGLIVYSWIAANDIAKKWANNEFSCYSLVVSRRIDIIGENINSLGKVISTT